MKKLLAALCIAVAGLACGPNIDLNERPLFSNGANTLTFMVYDAFTGAGIEDATINIQIGPHVIAAEHTTGNAYVASQLPPGTHLTVIDAPGHLQFLGQATAPSGGTLSNPASQTYVTYQVALYSSATVSQNVTVRAFDAETGAPITNGSLVAQLTGASGLGPTFSNQLQGTFTLRPSVLTVNFDSQGTAVLPSTSLVAGAEYTLDVFNAVNANGVYLQPQEDVEIDVGYDLNNVTMFLSAPSESVRALSANNENTSAVTQTLVVKFPYPVELCSTAAEHTWSHAPFSGDLDGDLVVATPHATTPVIATINNTTNELTLDPEYATPVDPDDGLTRITFSGVRVRVKGSSFCEPLNSVQLRTGGNVSSTITIQAAP